MLRKIAVTKKILFILLSTVCFIACSQNTDNASTTANKHTNPQDSLRTELLKVMNVSLNPGATTKFEIAYTEEKEGYTLSKLTILPESGEAIPGYLLKPKQIEAPYPVIICLQGHAPGMYISIGEARTEKDQKLIAGGRYLAIQAINNGWAALVVEQKGFGERAVGEVSCNDQSLQELMKGRPMLGQRAADITHAIDFIETQEDLDTSRIGCMGNSSGGTTSFFAACIDERIDLAVVSCSFSTYETSWLKYHHCSCGYLPGILEVGDMPDLASLIAPRKLMIVAGKEDYIADIEGVREGYAIAKKAFVEQNVPENIMLIEGDGGHQFYPDLAWPEINKFK